MTDRRRALRLHGHTWDSVMFMTTHARIPLDEVVGVNLDRANSARATPPSDGVIHTDEDHPHNTHLRML